jgi:hypothetical protein
MRKLNLGDVGPPMCYNCKRQSNADPLNCDAFPKGIPDPILFSRFDHRKPFAGDGGIRFEPIDPDIPVPTIDPEPAQAGVTI